MEEQDFNLINNATKIEKFKNFFFNNIKKLIAVTILILILMFSYFLLLDMKQKKIKRISENYNNLTLNFTESNIKQTNEGLTKIIYKKDKAYSPLALYFMIDNNIEKDTVTINKHFDFIINELGLDENLINLNIYKKALFNGDTADENFLLQILDPLIKNDTIWRSHALYLLGEYFYAKNDKIKAKEFYQNIITDTKSNKEIKLEAQKRLQRDLSD
tara:strand:+ start:939 stop:1586 length:648 start_codon:yes stop_codon:yes gene_type:complete